MNIYVVISIVLFVFFIIEQYSSNEKTNKYLFYIGSFLVVGLLAFRGDTVGGDTDDYCGYFTGVGGSYGIYETNDTFEIGFRWVCGLLMTVSRTEFWFLFSTSLITMLPFVYLVKRDSKGSKILPLFLYMAIQWNILSVTQTAIRQCISVSFVLIAYIIFTTHDIKKKWLRYALTVIFLIFAFISHNSSLIALPLMLVSYFIPFSRKSAIITVISSLIIILFFKNIFSDIFDIFAQYMAGVELAQHMLDTYYENATYALDAEISFRRLAPATFFVCLLIWLSNSEDCRKPYFKFLVMGTSLYNIGATFPMIFRAVYILLFMGIIYTPNNLKKAKSLFVKIVIILFLVYFIRTFAYSLIPNQPDQMLPYYFIWEK